MKTLTEAQRVADTLHRHAVAMEEYVEAHREDPDRFAYAFGYLTTSMKLAAEDLGRAS